jgi:hypothetical protein
MRRFSFGLFGLLILLGNKLGSVFGIALAICIFMIADGLIEEFRRRARRDMRKKEVK